MIAVHPITGTEIAADVYQDPEAPATDPTPPPDLSDLRVVEQEDIDVDVLAALAEAAGLEMRRVREVWSRPARVASPSYEGSLHAIADELVDALAGLDTASVDGLGARWAAALRLMFDRLAPSDRESHNWFWAAESLCTPALRELAALARSRQGGERMYVSVRVS